MALGEERGGWQVWDYESYTCTLHSTSSLDVQLWKMTLCLLFEVCVRACVYVLAGVCARARVCVLRGIKRCHDTSPNPISQNDSSQKGYSQNDSSQSDNFTECYFTETQFPEAQITECSNSPTAQFTERLKKVTSLTLSLIPIITLNGQKLDTNYRILTPLILLKTSQFD